MAKEFNIQGGYFSPPGYLKVETGGSHDENPNGGVQIGVDPNGIPNMLEEGEPVYDDYVYSDNITADKTILEQFHIPEKYAGKLYSEIADTFVDEAEDRPLDAISNNGLRAMLGRLADAQEQQKQNQEQKELEDELANMSPEELAELEAMLGQQEEVGEQVIPKQSIPSQQSVMPVMANGGLIRRFDEGTPGKYKIGDRSILGVLTGYAEDGTPIWESDEIDPSVVIADANPRLANIAKPTEFDWRGALDERYARHIKPLYDISQYRTLPNDEYTDTELLPMQINVDTTGLGPDDVDLGEDGVVDPQKLFPDLFDENNNKSNIGKFPTWMRYTGALGHGLLALGNAVTPQTRFTSRQARPYYPTGRINLIDHTYNPIDFGLTENALLASGAGTVNALRNSGSGPSTAASIIAADRNLGQNIGIGFLQNWNANNKQRNDVIAARNSNATQRANFNYQIDAARAQALDNAQRFNIQNDLYLQRLNDNAESQKYAAISGELGYGLDALTKMGDENMAFNMVNSTSDYGYDDKSGRVKYKRRASNGGTLLKKYKK